MLRLEWPLIILARTSVRYPSGSTSFNLQVSISEPTVAPMLGAAVRTRAQRILSGIVEL